MEKIFNQKNFNYFVWTPLGRKVNIYINFSLKVHLKVSAAWYCSHYLPPVSVTQVELVTNFAIGVIDTVDKFAHLDLRISQWIFEKIPNYPNVIFRGLSGRRIMKKTRSKKSRDTVSLSIATCQKEYIYALGAELLLGVSSVYSSSCAALHLDVSTPQGPELH